MKVFVLTDSPSPYQVELFNEVEARGNCSLEVAYLRSRDPDRQWKSAEIRHAAIELDRSAGERSCAREAVRNADLAVFNYYRHPQAEQLIKERTVLGSPWCFWGERPGFHQPSWPGRLVRKWKLSRLHASRAPIWGIGKFAIEGYKQEFGIKRTYFNLPYFSDLKRFTNSPRKTPTSERVFLFAGSLIDRKGVDLLAQAFVRLAREVPKVRLKIVGEGKLRESLVQTLGSDRVEFAGFKDWHELPAIYTSADVMCVPSRYDGWGMVVPEGLASGLPVIATERMGAALEFVETGRNGWLIPAGDGEAIFSAMREAALLPQAELAQLGQQARESVSSHTLHHGAARFFSYAQAAVSDWQCSSVSSVAVELNV